MSKAVRKPSPSIARLLAQVLGLGLVLLLPVLAPSDALAHSTTYAVYSKYEATTSDDSVAFVFALDKKAVFSFLENLPGHGAVVPSELARDRATFSTYFFNRFSVTNDGKLCNHASELSRFFWDEGTKRVVAVTKFTCAERLGTLEIRSLVTHDLPLNHELVGDLSHNGVLERSFFYDDNSVARIELKKMKAARMPPVGRRRGRFSQVSMPDQKRRYDALASQELEGADVGEAVDPHPLRTVMHFTGQGVLHIFTGYDHVLFIVTLLLSITTWRRLAIIVTSFTIAHSLTLIVATLGLLTISPLLIEPLIALSVLFVAVDALLRPQASARAWVTFGFGLVHGFGLSSVLRDLGLSGSELAPALLGFNLGVEVGQLCIVAPLFPLVLLLRKREHLYLPARKVMCGSVALLAVAWIVLRVQEAVVS
jgi:hypothetical protein